jgi:hypothetical protein
MLPELMSLPACRTSVMKDSEMIRKISVSSEISRSPARDEEMAALKREFTPD